MSPVTANSTKVSPTLTPYVVLCSTVALMMVAPAISAASPAAASPASQGVSRPIAPASSVVPTKYISHWPAPISANSCSRPPVSLARAAITKTAAIRICAAQSSVLVRRRGLASRIASRAAVTRAVGVITAVSFVVCFIGSSLLADTRATLVARTCGVGVVGVGGQVMSRLLSSAVPRAGLRHATHARNRPPGPVSAERPQAEQATYAARPIRRSPAAYQARPGRRPTQWRLAACLRTHKRASKRAPSAVRPVQPARYGTARTAAAPRTAGGSTTRTAAQPAPPRTRRPRPARSSTTPRYTDPADRNSRLIRLTDRGRRLYERIEAVAATIEAEWAEQAGAPRLEELRTSLRRSADMPAGPAGKAAALNPARIATTEAIAGLQALQRGTRH